MDISIMTDDGRLNIRAAALIIKDGKLLISRSKKLYWHTIGGRIHMGEDSKTAVEREVLEETGHYFEAGRLLAVSETFFKEGVPFHEYNFVYLMTPNGEEEQIGDSYTEGDMVEVMRWVPLEELDQVDLRPSFIKDLAHRLPETTEHIVIKD